MSLTIALAGNPNSGKTTLFNLLTGSNQYVGNWPGVTVEKKEGTLRHNKQVTVTDLPGIYSLSPYTPEEIVARTYLVKDRPDVIINIVDGTNLERNLYLSTQLMDLGLPVVLAVNMMDAVNVSGDMIDTKKLSEQTRCPVVAISALKNTGIDDLVDEATKAAVAKTAPSPIPCSDATERAIEKIAALALEGVPRDLRRWYALRLLEKDEQATKDLLITSDARQIIHSLIAEFELAQGDRAESIITFDRYRAVTQILQGSFDKKDKHGLSTSDKIDKIVTSRHFALPIFAVVMFVVYYVSVTTVGAYVTDFTNDGLFGAGFSFFGAWVPGVPAAVGGWMASANIASWLQSLVLDGIIGGVGAVLGFVPQMFVLFFFLSLLEACGYMARIAFIMDRVFRRFGLSGKSFIPMLIGSGCSVPGIMATRTIENDRDRRMTIITTSFIPCGAKLPVIAMFAGALFGGAWWVSPVAYLMGILAVLVSGIILKKTRMMGGGSAPFVMELPAYRLPAFKSVASATWERGWSFVKKAGSIILLSSIFVWFISAFGIVDGRMQRAGDLGTSFAATIGGGVAFVFKPLGFGDWQSAVATVMGLVAKENIVSAFGVLFGFAELTEQGAEIWGQLAQHYTVLGGFSMLIFNLLCAPCIAAVGAISREMKSLKWTLFAIGYHTVFAYAASLIFYQLGSLILNGVFGIWTVIAFLVLAGAVYALARKDHFDEKNTLQRTAA